jgi:serine/threonine protein kinase/tetratricopeptide (TPR) repeat protein
MADSRWQRIEEIFERAADLPLDARPAYLDEACAADAALRREVESLLSHDHNTGAFVSHAVGRAAAAAATPDPAATQIGPYRITREIGHGGMGTVYLAERTDGQFHRQVAIKVVSRGMDTDFVVERFRHERQILASLQHPNIARLFDGGVTDDGRPWIAMEYIEGATLTDYCATRPLRDRLTLFRKICAAVQYAHSNLIVHRDLKPSNILVGADGEPRLLDFGIAKILNPEEAGVTVPLTRTAVRLLTPEYASPEQIRGEPITTATDVYALGAILSDLIPGSRAQPVGTLSAIELERAICEREPARPSTVVRGIDPELDTVVQMALRKEPARRYPTAQAFADDIDRYLTDRPVIARPDTLRYRTTKFIRRNRLAVAAAVALSLTLIAGITAALWQARRAEQNAARAERRFAQVRKLANTFLFEFDGKISNLAGATSARELVVRTALEYLDSLASEAGNDPDLALELAEAYDRIGDIQGQMGADNLGRTTQAAVSYRKALALRTAVAALRPGNTRVQRALAEGHIRLCDFESVMTRLEPSLEHARKATALLDEIRARDGESDKLDETLATTYRKQGRMLIKLSRVDEGLESYRRYLSIMERRAARKPGDEGAYELAMGYKGVGYALKVLYRDEALDFYRKSEHFFRQSLAREPNNARVIRNFAHMNQEFSDVLANPFVPRTPDLKAAAEHDREAIRLLEAIAKTDSASNQKNWDLGMGHAELAETITPIDPKAAIEYFRTAIRYAEAFVARDPERADGRRALGAIYEVAAHPHFDTANYATAEQLNTKAIAIYDDLHAKQPNNNELIVERQRNYAGRALARLKQRQLAAAEKDATQCATLAAKIPLSTARLYDLNNLWPCYDALGQLHLAQNRPAEAKQAFTQGHAIWQELRRRGYRSPYIDEKERYFAAKRN